MGIQERKEREKELRRASIIDCAMKVFLEKGFVNSTMDEIAECVELSKATLYLYFKNKEEIIIHVMNCVLCKFIEYLEVKMSRVEPAIDKIRMAGEAYLDFYSDYHGQFILLNSQESMAGMDLSSQESYHEYVGQTKRLWATICAPIYIAVEEDFFQTDANAVEIAITLWSASTGLMHLMDEVVTTVNCDNYKNLTDMTDFQKQLPLLDYKKMLRNLWDAIIISYQNK